MNSKTVSSGFGQNIHVEISGGSHEPCVSAVVTGLPGGFAIDMEKLRAFTALRAPGNSPWATVRKEADEPVITTGLEADGITTDGSPLTITIENTDARSADYKRVKSVPRPGHADFTARMKYDKDGEYNGPCMAGGGPFSARMTAPLCAAGGIALQMLEKRGVNIGAHLFSVGDIYDEPFDPSAVTGDELLALSKSSFPVNDTAAGKKMQEHILTLKEQGDSAGGIVEAAVTGLPAGIGGSMYGGVESVLSPILFGIPAVKGIEFGTGFAASSLKGSENNDPFIIKDGKIVTLTNHHGGILGGITSGMPLIVRVAFKPTPSIALPQDSVDMEKMEPVKLSIQGRHDPCVVVRAVPAVNAALALGLLDMLTERKTK